MRLLVFLCALLLSGCGFTATEPTHQDLVVSVNLDKEDTIYAGQEFACENQAGKATAAEKLDSLSSSLGLSVDQFALPGIIEADWQGRLLAFNGKDELVAVADETHVIVYPDGSCSVKFTFGSFLPVSGPIVFRPYSMSTQWSVPKDAVSTGYVGLAGAGVRF